MSFRTGRVLIHVSYKENFESAAFIKQFQVHLLSNFHWTISVINAEMWLSNTIRCLEKVLQSFHGTHIDQPYAKIKVIKLFRLFLYRSILIKKKCMCVCSRWQGEYASYTEWFRWGYSKADHDASVIRVDCHIL